MRCIKCNMDLSESGPHFCIGSVTVAGSGTYSGPHVVTKMEEIEKLKADLKVLAEEVLDLHSWDVNRPLPFRGFKDCGCSDCQTARRYVNE